MFITGLGALSNINPTGCVERTAFVLVSGEAQLLRRRKNTVDISFLSQG